MRGTPTAYLLWLALLVAVSAHSASSSGEGNEIASVSGLIIE